MVDLRDASAKFLKIGSTPSFVKRANNILKIEASNLPMGIIEDVEVDVVGEQLKTGDILIMMSDGIFEGAQHVENHELWMKRKIKELQTEDPQEIADIIMEEVIRSGDGYINDDMTIVVAKVKKKYAEVGYHSNCGNAGTIKLKCDVPLSLFLSKNLGEYLGFLL